MAWLQRVLLIFVFARLVAGSLSGLRDLKERPPDPWLRLISDLGMAALFAALWWPMTSDLFAMHLATRTAAVLLASIGYFAAALVAVTAYVHFSRPESRSVVRRL